MIQLQAELLDVHGTRDALRRMGNQQLAEKIQRALDENLTVIASISAFQYADLNPLIQEQVRKYKANSANMEQALEQLVNNCQTTPEEKPR